MSNRFLSKFENNEKIILLISFCIIAIYLLPLYIFGENTHVRVHDNLDSNVAWYRTLINSGQLFAPLDATIPQIMNGTLPRGALESEFSLIVWLYVLFPTMVAYAISQTLTRIFAFIGMYLLLKTHVLKDKKMRIINAFVSVCFALTPFWPSGMLSTLGMPLALWAFLSIRSGGGHWKHWLTIILLPFYSSFVLGFFFFLTAIGILWLYDLMTKKRFNLPFFGSLCLMTTLYLIVGYRLMSSLVIKGVPNSRQEFVSSRLSLASTVRLTFKNFIIGHTHDLTMHTFIILPLTLVILGLILINRKWKEEKSFILLFILNFALSTWYAFWFFKGWRPIKEHFTFLRTFNFARFHFLRPLVIYVSFAIGLGILWKIGKYGRQLVVLLLIAQIGILFYFNDAFLYKNQPTVKQFFAVNQFQDIKKYIGKNPSSYRVISLGLHPSIAQYNGFYTLDSYNNYYPLSYKYEFRKIIASELDKKASLKKYYDTWGNRVYLFSSELGKKYDYRSYSKKKVKHLNLNTRALWRMGGRYVISSVPILNAHHNHLSLLKTFRDAASSTAWKIYLYQVHPE
ncbi:DUF6044 family protein [Terrilactibacillus laevilacticus]|uniref:DUF6044 family protein n=1 Tax=Terrilactibacillus laevilacticus TaxID=1380157 RepID=A0ABW5PSH5_9BACI|nr:DUF6044 family protein [Terrilactibacillus laevilacticus]